MNSLGHETHFVLEHRALSASPEHQDVNMLPLERDAVHRNLAIIQAHR